MNEHTTCMYESCYNIAKVPIAKYSDVLNLTAGEWRSNKYGDPIVHIKIAGVKDVIFGKAGGYTGITETDKVIDDVSNISVIFLSVPATDIMIKSGKALGDIVTVKIGNHVRKGTFLKWSRGSSHIRLNTELKLDKKDAYNLLKKSQKKFMQLENK